jgi:hypothetical protein
MGKGGDNTREHNALRDRARLAVGTRADVIVWNAPVGLFRTFEPPFTPFHVGIAGQSDTMAVVEVEITQDMVGKKVGVFWGMEFKTGKAVLSPQQVKWRDRVTQRHAVYTEIRDIAQVAETLKQIKDGTAFSK